MKALRPWILEQPLPIGRPKVSKGGGNPWAPLGPVLVPGHSLLAFSPSPESQACVTLERVATHLPYPTLGPRGTARLRKGSKAPDAARW